MSDRSRPLPICCFCKSQQWLPSPHSDAVPGLSGTVPHNCAPSSAMAGFHPPEELHHKARESGAVVCCKPVCMLGRWQEIGQSPRQFQFTFSILSQEQASTCTLFRSGVLVFYSPPVSPIGFQTSSGAHLSSVVLQGWGAQCVV